MISEPFKLKEVKSLPRLEPCERVDALLRGGYNPLRIPSDKVPFDLVARGTSAWSHFQKAGLQVGDEAYAGALNYYNLAEACHQVLGIPADRIVPTHNGIGAEKLLCTTMLKRGQTVPHNRGRCEGLIPANGGMSVDVSVPAGSCDDPARFRSNVDLPKLEALLRTIGKEGIPFVYLETCPDDRDSQPFSLANLEQVHKLARHHGVPVALDISNVLEAAYWIQKAETVKLDLLAVARRLVELADIVLMDAAQDPRCDTGGLIASRHQEYF